MIARAAFLAMLFGETHPASRYGDSPIRDYFGQAAASESLRMQYAA
jgi:hypothetical protein